MRKSRVKGGDQHAISARIDKNIWYWLKAEPNKNIENDFFEDDDLPF